MPLKEGSKPSNSRNTAASQVLCGLTMVNTVKSSMLPIVWLFVGQLKILGTVHAKTSSENPLFMRPTNRKGSLFSKIRCENRTRAQKLGVYFPSTFQHLAMPLDL